MDLSKPDTICVYCGTDSGEGKRLRSCLTLLEKAIDKHRCAIWGVDGKVAHDQDVILYAALEALKEGEEKC